MSSNGNIYKCSDGLKSIIIKEKHKATNAVGGVVKQISQEYDNEVKVLSSLPNEFKNRLKIIGYTRGKNGVETIATEYVEGEKIDANKKSFNKTNLAQLYRDLLYLDSAKILHRDLTAYNILADKKGNLKIIDYGASKTFSEMKQLAKEGKIKYKTPEYMPYNNMENFEENGLNIYLTQLASLKGGKKEARELFEIHIGLKAEYYNRLFEIYKKQDIDNNTLIMENIDTYRKTYSFVKNKKLSEEELKDLLETEKLRIKMNHSQKRVRLYTSNTVKNFLTGNYWNILEGCYCKALIINSDNLVKKYKNNDTLRNYYELQSKIGSFHYENIFLPVYKNNLCKIDNYLSEDNLDNIKTVLEEGNLLGIKDLDDDWCGPAIPIYKVLKNNDY